jgi:hypothetical protein
VALLKSLALAGASCALSDCRQRSALCVFEESSNFIDKASNLNTKIFYKDGGHLNILGNLLWGELIYEDITKNKAKF